VLEAFLQAVCDFLALEFKLLGLKGPDVTHGGQRLVSLSSNLSSCRVRSLEVMNIRCGGGIEQDVAVLEVLSFRAVLQVLLEGVSALWWAPGGRNGCGVDDGGGFDAVRHGSSLLL
jgi:hypothetical protein